jgi:predicted Zn-dependent peptidase
MYKIKQLSNGINVVIEEVNYVKSISFGIWVKVGSQDEDENLNGVSHFIEHMHFKGTKKRSAKQIAEEMDAIGGQMNAFTSKTMTCYYTKIINYNFDAALDIMADMILNSTFDETELEKEKKVIIEEINMYEDTPDELIFDVLCANVWSGSSVARSILGKSQNIQKFSRDDIINYRSLHYTADNIIITVAGNCNIDDVFEKLEHYFGCVPKGTGNRKELKVNYKKSIAIKQKNIEQVHICIAFPSIKTCLEQNYIITLLNTIFGGGMSSRLYQKVREENGLAYSLFSHNLSNKAAGLFVIYAAVNPDKVEECIKLIVSEIKNLKNDPITEQQLSKTKEQLKANYLMSLESSSNIMNNLGKSMMLYDQVITSEEIIKRIDDVSLNNIYDMIDKVFDLNMMSLCSIGEKSYDFAKIIESVMNE